MGIKEFLTLKIIPLTMLALLALNNVFGQQNPASNTSALNNSKQTAIYNEVTKAYYSGNYKTAAELGERAVLMENQKISDLVLLYSIVGRSNAKIGNINKALDYLEKAVALGYGKDGQYASLVVDPKVQILHTYPQWKTLIEACWKNFIEDTKSKGDNPDVKLLFEQDQAERNTLLPELIKQNPSGLREANIAMLERDEARREQIKVLIKRKRLKTSNDYRAAAFILQHGTELKDIKLANKLAKNGYEIAKNNEEKCGVGWIAAATTDRILWYQGKPQIYGTQSRPVSISLEELNYLVKNWRNLSKEMPNIMPGTKMTLDPIDKTKATDEERKRLCVAPLGELLKNTVSGKMSLNQ